MTETTSETPVLDLLGSMTADSMSTSTLDDETLMLVRIAALVAVDAPSVSYLMNLAVAGELDIDSDRIRGVLAAVAPIVGTPRVASAMGKIVEALAVELEIAEVEEADEGEAEEEEAGAADDTEAGAADEAEEEEEGAADEAEEEESAEKDDRKA
jgi:4-carboxymuconolactone decarboxylase